MTQLLLYSHPSFSHFYKHGHDDHKNPYVKYQKMVNKPNLKRL